MQYESKTETFDALVKDFDLDPRIGVMLNDAGICDPEELRFYCDSEGMVTNLVGDNAETKKLDTAQVQVSRLRRAW